MTRFLLNPTFDIETGRLLSHDGESFEEHKIFFHRAFTQHAKHQGHTTLPLYCWTTSGAGRRRAAGQRTGSHNPQGFALNRYQQLAGEAAGSGESANATITGEGKLAALRTRNAGGFAPALAEASRQQGRNLATGALDVANQNAMLKQQQQQSGIAGLQGLYGTDTSQQLKAMGLSAEDLQNQLAAGRQGWLQNTEGVLNTISNMGSKAAGAYGDLGLAT